MSTLTVSPHEPLTSRGKAVLGAAVAVLLHHLADSNRRKPN